MYFGAGALHLEGGAAVLVRMTFEGNGAQGGAMSVRNATLVVRDSAFIANASPSSPPAASSGPSADTVDIVNTTFVRNTTFRHPATLL